MHFSCNNYETLSSFLPALSECWQRLGGAGLFHKSFTAQPLLRCLAGLYHQRAVASPLAGVRGCWMSPCLRGYSPPCLGSGIVVCKLGGRPWPCPGPAWTLVKLLQNSSCGLSASTSTRWQKAWCSDIHRSSGSFPEQASMIKVNWASLPGGPDPRARGTGDTGLVSRALMVARGNNEEGSHSCFLREFSKNSKWLPEHSSFINRQYSIS